MFRTLWEKVRHRIDKYYFEKDMMMYERAAWKLKEIVDQYLKTQGHHFVSGVFRKPEDFDYPKVTVKVLVELKPYKKVLELWDKACEVSYPQLTHSEQRGVFLHFEPYGEGT